MQVEHLKLTSINNLGTRQPIVHSYPIQISKWNSRLLNSLYTFWNDNYLPLISRVTWYTKIFTPIKLEQTKYRDLKKSGDNLAVSSGESGVHFMVSTQVSESECQFALQGRFVVTFSCRT